MTLQQPLLRDVEAVGRLSAVPAILQAVIRTTGMRFAAVARVTNTTWTACAVYDLVDFGLRPGGQLELETTICNEIRQHGKPVIFCDAAQSVGYAEHHTPRVYGLRSYVSVPIVRRNGSFFGTLCAIDPLPVSMDEENVLATFQLFAQLISFQLDAEERIGKISEKLQMAEETAKLREQFIAVLGHDLRNPLQAITMGAELLAFAPLDPGSRRNVERIQQSCERMAELTDNVLDFARGRLGGGIPVALRPNSHLAEDLEHVLAEICLANPAVELDVSLDITDAVVCDRRRLAQLLGNLVSNAIVHGDAERPIRVTAQCRLGMFELTVSNQGHKIPDERIAQLFLPFSRTDNTIPRPGLGLGLYIAAEIAKSHHGILTASSTHEKTSFTFVMPMN